MLWAFWAFALLPGVDATPLLSRPVLIGCSALFVLSELMGMIVGIYAAHRAGHRHLMPWVPTLILYFPLGTAAVFKALAEVVTRPFYWDKTTHGVFDAAAEAPDAVPQRDADLASSNGEEPPASAADPDTTDAATAEAIAYAAATEAALAANRIMPSRPAGMPQSHRRPRPPLILTHPVRSAITTRTPRAGRSPVREDRARHRVPSE